MTDQRRSKPGSSSVQPADPRQRLAESRHFWRPSGELTPETEKSKSNFSSPAPAPQCSTPFTHTELWLKRYISPSIISKVQERVETEDSVTTHIPYRDGRRMGQEVALLRQRQVDSQSFHYNNEASRCLMATQSSCEWNEGEQTAVCPLTEKSLHRFYKHKKPVTIWLLPETLQIKVIVRHRRQMLFPPVSACHLIRVLPAGLAPSNPDVHPATGWMFNDWMKQMRAEGALVPFCF